MTKPETKEYQHFPAACLNFAFFWPSGAFYTLDESKVGSTIKMPQKAKRMRNLHICAPQGRHFSATKLSNIVRCALVQVRRLARLASGGVGGPPPTP